MPQAPQFHLTFGEEKISQQRLDLEWKAWPEFMHHDAKINALWGNLYRDFPEYQVVVYEGEQIAGLFNTLPIHYIDTIENLPEEGLDWAFQKAHEDFEAGRIPNLLVGIQILIHPDYQGQGFSYHMLDFMKEVAIKHQLKAIALPLRPTFKSKYPSMPMQEYMHWKKEDDLPFDPWIRVHIKAGGRLIKTCNDSMDITGTIAEWKRWTGMQFEKSGNYEVEGALCPVQIDLENDLGCYMEPNVWVVHVF